ncbi:MAG: NADP-dependent isocitrate dehydrogenase [Polyangiales bacterium]
MSKKPEIVYTKTDEAPALATYAFLPVIRAFTKDAGIDVVSGDISLAARILAQFPESLTEAQRVPDTLSELGALSLKPEANIIKLPNISASVPQLKEAIAELQAHGYKIPDFPESPKTDEERETLKRYNKVKGSAVNPVLREGNSDRRAPAAVKEYARQNPHSMGKWNAQSKTRVSTMSADDFAHNEKSVTVPAPTTVKIELVDTSGAATTLKDKIALEKGEIIDGTVMSRAALLAFLKEQVAASKRDGVLFSLHMKATMMKVSDPIIFGHAVRTFFSDLFEKHGATFQTLGVNVNNGFGDLIAKIQTLPADKRQAIEADIQNALDNGPALAMVDSDKGITNLHVPSDVIIDASMPAMIRSSGQMWNATGKLQDTNAVIPDSSYAGIYQAVIDDCIANGAYDPVTMGSVSNVGLMAKQAEEYGSHDKTFEINADGKVRVVDANGNTLIEHDVNAGDIWRMCQVKDAPVEDWVKLAVRRARATNTPVVFWLDKNRAHDAEVIKKVNANLATLDTNGLTIKILSPVEATKYSLERIRKGQDTISATGNVLRDYLTDLFPILELGTSAKMLSIVPLMNGGGLFETGAGGSAPKHVEQFDNENHLRWDSLGEFMALVVSFEHLSEMFNNADAKVLGAALEEATTQYLLQNRSPSRKVKELDNRGSQYYLTRYWAEALSKQTKSPALAKRFAPVAKALAEDESKIVNELNAVQGQPVDIGGYYQPDDARATAAMRPSATYNAIIDAI